MGKTVAQLILEQLAAWGIPRIYGVIGDAIFPLADALSRQNQIQYIPCAIETGASFMAYSSAQLTGGLGVCLGTSGPGAANLINGTAGAFLDSVPLLCITGQVPTDKLGTASKQDIDLNQLFAGVTAVSRMCVHPDAVLPALNELIGMAFQLQTAVHLSVPKDVLAMESQQPVAKPIYPFSLETSGTTRGDLNRLRTSCERSQKPILLIGKASRPFAKELYDLAGHLNAGIIPTQESKGVFPDADPLVFGGIGEAYLPVCWNETDLILIFGGSIYEKRFFPAHAEVWNIDPGPFRDFKNPQQIVGDLRDIIRFLKSVPVTDRTDWRYRLSAARKERLHAISLLPPGHPGAFCRLLSEIINPDAICTLDVGEFVYWFNFAFQAKQQTVLHSTKWRSMGSAIPAGIAVCLERPGIQVVTLVGDGGLLMSLSELSTLARYRMPLAVCVLINRVFGLEKHKMVKEHDTPFGTEVTPPDIVKLADSFGIAGYQLENASTDGDVLREAFRKAPALIEVPISSPELPFL